MVVIGITNSKPGIEMTFIWILKAWQHPVAATRVVPSETRCKYIHVSSAANIPVGEGLRGNNPYPRLDCLDSYRKNPNLEAQVFFEFSVYATSLAITKWVQIPPAFP